MATYCVGVVIPAFNEEAGLPRVLDAVCATNWLAQIAVVDDGSTDDTWTVAQRYALRDERLTALRLPTNQGKANAMLAGVQALHTDIVIFLDADLIGLRPQYLSRLYTPVLNHVCEMTVAVFRHGRVSTDISHLITPMLSGQRCLWHEVAVQALTPLANTGYGVEVELTAYARRRNWRTQYVVWEQMTHMRKEEKRGWLAGLGSRWQMYCEIAAVLIADKKHFLPSRSNNHQGELRGPAKGVGR